MYIASVAHSCMDGNTTSALVGQSISLTKTTEKIQLFCYGILLKLKKSGGSKPVVGLISWYHS